MRGPSTSTGFSLTELVMILVLLGILAVFAVPRLDIQGFERQSFARELIAALNHAQRIALGSGCHVAVEISSGGYSVNYTGAGNDCSSVPVPHPSRSGNFTGSGDVISNVTVVFDAFGRSDGATINLADGTTITVEAETGHVHR
ncbi:prepilin-type cleavage/methylation domain-containing protein [Wenzhouxiangella sp. AB-CW3]|uniref:pilus assembly FimT family protein n=1 Tax=Wenzhouxiangella sp. AB-CW3 TaxID=2771012 RepID=UPI00168B72C2|nr:GspH/FimT family pseudopilin [Wenzhouxiangella sp. AB-CW3]QOC23829.1 prepilin-type cleavage/methylation domain-containing protein [Wenzhouxiangella sp. AB-CW3]